MSNSSSESFWEWMFLDSGNIISDHTVILHTESRLWWAGWYSGGWTIWTILATSAAWKGPKYWTRKTMYPGRESRRPSEFTKEARTEQGHRPGHPSCHPPMGVTWSKRVMWHQRPLVAIPWQRQRDSAKNSGLFSTIILTLCGECVIRKFRIYYSVDVFDLEPMLTAVQTVWKVGDRQLWSWTIPVWKEPGSQGQRSLPPPRHDSLWGLVAQTRAPWKNSTFITKGILHGVYYKNSP